VAKQTVQTSVLDVFLFSCVVVGVMIVVLTAKQHDGVVYATKTVVSVRYTPNEAYIKADDGTVYRGTCRDGDLAAQVKQWTAPEHAWSK